MARVLITEDYLTDIGDAIREKLDVETTYKVSEMADAIESIEGYPEPTGTKSITANGTGIDVKDYASADVNVPNSYTSSDEGKVVSNGALASQTSVTKTANGTYDTTLNNEVVVDVEGYTVERIDESGSIVSFETEFDDIPLSDLVADIVPAQNLHGYDKPWAGGNGKNLLENNWVTKTHNGVTFTANADGSITANGTASETGFAAVAMAIDTDTLHGDYYYNGAYDGSSSTYNAYIWDNTTASRAKKWDGTSNVENGYTALQQVKLVQGHTIVFQCRVMAGQTVNNLTFYPMICASTETDTSFEPYTNICPISGLDEVNVYVSPTTSEQDATVYTNDLDGTRYGGTLDVTSGVLKVCPYYASYNGETLTGEWISDRDVYSPNTSPSIGAQVVNIGGALTTVQLTPTQVQTISGTNHVWADSGDVEVKTIEINAL